MTTNDGGPAFPVIPPCDIEGASASGYPYPSEGMSLRDYFAAKAMGAMLSNFDWMRHTERNTAIPGEEAVVIMAYEIADGMLKERAK